YFHDNMAPFWRRFYITMEKIAARCSDLILSQNREDIETAIRERICRPEKIQYLGNGFDIQRFEQTCVDETVLAAKRRELGLPAGVPVVGFVGRLVAEKGILELLKAARLILQRLPATKFLIVGPIDYDKPDA